MSRSSRATTTAAADRLAGPRERGTLRLAYRRSAMGLSSIMERLLPGSTGTVTGEQSNAGEREPLLNNEQQGAAAAPSTSYGSVLDLPPARRVPKPKPVKSPVRVEAKVWFANEVCSKKQAAHKAELPLSELDVPFTKSR